ncbi:hypothetical protein EIN_054640 [Entamoeba invadens IP1]|uniref:hypothetical protein n=1 Tax=Entamoeba invadens IP1 TaxID=370355 RepID=UPI0002C3D3A5|nr:hypothetical protein EIN_054640 [Entamoeba invadens IP1]ELP93179.1 hypothetical protein EIN_054640 [Entamoeba invadens IP1]|eukprot:XP_004259950.1 hypothetical protein EIN_054640 [Entamoeba invadens IP1]
MKYIKDLLKFHNKIYDCHISIYNKKSKKVFELLKNLSMSLITTSAHESASDSPVQQPKAQHIIGISNTLMSKPKLKEKKPLIDEPPTQTVYDNSKSGIITEDTPIQNQLPSKNTITSDDDNNPFLNTPKDSVESQLDSGTFDFGSAEEGSDVSCECVCDNKETERVGVKLKLSDFKQSSKQTDFGFELGYGLNSDDGSVKPSLVEPSKFSNKEKKEEKAEKILLPQKVEMADGIKDDEFPSKPVVEEKSAPRNFQTTFESSDKTTTPKFEEDKSSYSGFDDFGNSEEFGSSSLVQKSSCIETQMHVQQPTSGVIDEHPTISKGSFIEEHKMEGKSIKMWQPSLSDFKKNDENTQKDMTIENLKETENTKNDETGDARICCESSKQKRKKHFSTNKTVELEPRQSFMIKGTHNKDEKNMSIRGFKGVKAMEIRQRVVEDEERLRKEEEERRERQELENKTSALEQDKEENLKNGIIASYLPLLQEWTKKKKYNVIFNSKFDGLNRETFNNRVCLKENIMFLVFTKEGHLFGSFNTKRMPAHMTEGFIMDDQTHFVFTLRNSKDCPPTKFTKKSWNGPSVGINFSGFKEGDDDGMILAVRWAFYIREKSGSISPSFTSVYNDIVGKEYFVFTTNTLINVERLVALEWKDE